MPGGIGIGQVRLYAPTVGATGKPSLVGRQEQGGEHVGGLRSDVVSDADLSRIQALLDAGNALDPESARMLVAETRRLRALVSEHLTVTIRPIAAQGTEPAQAWFWTPEWQQREREADEDIAAGRIRHFDDAESLLAYLDRER